jgi:hypothetical protein
MVYRYKQTCQKEKRKKKKEHYLQTIINGCAFQKKKIYIYICLIMALPVITNWHFCRGEKIWVDRVFFVDVPFLHWAISQFVCKNRIFNWLSPFKLSVYK